MSQRFAIGLTTMAALVALWYLATIPLALISPGRFPSPFDVWFAFHQVAFIGYANGLLYQHVLHSLQLVIVGFLVAAVTGVPLGLSDGMEPARRGAYQSRISIHQANPAACLDSAGDLVAGIGDAAKIMVIWFAAFVPSVINSFTGVRTIDSYVIEAARMLGTPRYRFRTEVLVPAAAPLIFTGLRLSLQASWTTLVAAELVGALYGLGRILNVAQQDIYPGMIFVGMATAWRFSAGL